jgi:hypothetical protein
MDNPEILETLVTQDTGHTIGSKQTLDKTDRQSRMDNPVFAVSLDWPFFIVARFSFTFIYCILYVLCLMLPMFPVSLDCPFFIVIRLFLMLTERKSRTDNPEKLEKLITSDTEQAIGSK